MTGTGNKCNGSLLLGVLRYYPLERNHGTGMLEEDEVEAAGVASATGRYSMSFERWLGRLHSGYDDVFQRTSSRELVSSENAVGAAFVPRCKAM